MKTVMNSPTCPMEHTMKVIGGKWKLVILWYLSQKTQRYSELKRAIPSITSKMLTQQLRELETDGVISRKVYPVVPPHVEYSLTSLGKSLLPIIDQLHHWGKLSRSESVAQPSSKLEPVMATG